MWMRTTASSAKAGGGWPLSEAAIFMPAAVHKRLHSFPPIAAADARVLILGSMPGEASLAAGEYYAHPRNAFWPIMGALLGFDPALPYAERARRLAAAGVALWDVAQSCVRPGSLDARMRDITPNDFAPFLAAHPGIRHVFFNGAKAEELFVRLVLRRGIAAGIPRRRLPSTSPAHASLRPDEKRERWRIVLQALNPAGHAPIKRPSESMEAT